MSRSSNVICVLCVCMCVCVCVCVRAHACACACVLTRACFGTGLELWLVWVASTNSHSSSKSVGGQCNIRPQANFFILP